MIDSSPLFQPKDQRVYTGQAAGQQGGSDLHITSLHTLMSYTHNIKTRTFQMHMSVVVILTHIHTHTHCSATINRYPKGKLSNLSSKDLKYNRRCNLYTHAYTYFLCNFAFQKTNQNPWWVFPSKCDLLLAESTAFMNSRLVASQ